MPNSTSADVKGRYAAPEDVLRDSSLSLDAKRAVLVQWQRDLKQLHTATEENMPALTRQTPEQHDRDGETAEYLQRVSNCLLVLDAD